MARSLIENMTDHFDPDEFHDDYREKLEEVVQAKIEGKEIAIVEETGTATVVDLMEALKASVEQTSGKPEKRAAKKKSAEKAPAKKKKAATGMNLASLTDYNLESTASTRRRSTTAAPTRTASCSSPADGWPTR